MLHINERERVLSALEKDINRRYISIGRLQSDGRLELDKACIDILQPKEDESFSLVNDYSSIIIVRNPKLTDDIISTVRWDSSKKRLRLPPSAIRILLACTVGIRAFMYNKEVALEIEPYLQPPNKRFIDAETVEQLAPHVLRPPRSILHEDILTDTTVIDQPVLFRLAGEFWDRRQHQDPLDKDLKWHLCTGVNCKFCNEQFPIISRTIWFPCLSYDTNKWFPRPTLLSFRMGRSVWNSKSVCIPLINECFAFSRSNPEVEPYFIKGSVSYQGDSLFELLNDSSGKLTIDKPSHEELQRNFSIEEKGLLKIAFKELQEFISSYEKKISTSN
jgi:hypothetical protein